MFSTHFHALEPSGSRSGRAKFILEAAERIRKEAREQRKAKRAKARDLAGDPRVNGAASDGDEFEDAADNMSEFDSIDGADPPECLGKLGSIKVPWDSDVSYWFSELESQMDIIQIKSQWIKRVVCSNNLPPEVKAEMKALLKKTKIQCTGEYKNIYKVLKVKTIELFGATEDDAFERAAQLTLKGKPSALAKELTEIMCDCCDPPLSACCGSKTVGALWRRQLPDQVRSAIAGMSLKTQYEDTLKHADNVFASLKRIPGAPVAAVAAGDPQQDEQEGQEVAAYGRGRGGARGAGGGRGGRRPFRGRGPGRGQGRGQGRGAGQQGPRHNDDVPEGACNQHKKFGRAAWACSNRDNCPWRNVTSPRE